MSDRSMNLRRPGSTDTGRRNRLLILVVLVALVACNQLQVQPAPRVTSTVPEDGATAVPWDIVPRATLTAAAGIDTTTIDGSTVRLLEAVSGDAVPATVSHQDAGATILIEPAEPLAASTRYVFILGSGIRDTQGRQLQSKVVDFETDGFPPGSRPTVLGSSPSDGSVDVTLTASVEVYLDPGESPLDADTVNISTVRLLQAGSGTRIAGSVSLVDGDTIVFDPAQSLDFGMEYVLRLNGIENDAGFSLLETEIGFQTLVEPRPWISSSIPVDGATGIHRDTAVHTALHLVPHPDDDKSAGVDENTVTDETVMLRRASDGQPVEGLLTVSGGRDSIIFSPTLPLEKSTTYEFEITDGVHDLAGRPFLPFEMEFTTGDEFKVEPEPVAFEKVQVYSGQPVASVVIAPGGGWLYATSLIGNVLRWPIQSDGMLGSVESYSLGNRALTGLAFDPVDPNILWVAHNDPISYEQDAPVPPDFSSAIARVEIGPGGLATAVHENAIVGLPRSAIDHMTNSLVFGPDGALYVTQGSNTSNGATDAAWTKGRPERLLTAAVLRVDTDLLMSQPLPLDVQTEPLSGDPGDYDPFAPGAPLTIFATGLRNAYDIVWHSDGHLYSPVNGGNGGNTPGSPAGVEPAVPALENVGPQLDFLYRVEEGGYYGHPNPLRGEYVLNGGNPTAGDDGPDEVAPGGAYEGYPVGVDPDPNYRGYVIPFEFNDSANGVIEYKSGTFGGALADKLLIVRYSAGKDIVSVDLENYSEDSPYKIVEEALNWPVDLIEDTSNGNIYVAETSWDNSGRIQLLRVPSEE